MTSMGKSEDLHNKCIYVLNSTKYVRRIIIIFLRSSGSVAGSLYFSNATSQQGGILDLSLATIHQSLMVATKGRTKSSALPKIRILRSWCGKHVGMHVNEVQSRNPDFFRRPRVTENARYLTPKITEVLGNI